MNPGPSNIDGKALTQPGLRRGDARNEACVRKMLGAVCCRLVGKIPSGPSSDMDAKVWADVARFLGARLQGPLDCPGRAPDMSLASATEMRSVLAQFEAGALLMSNREKVALDIANPGPAAVGGGVLTQPELQRVDQKHKDSVQNMVDQVSACLLGTRSSLSGARGTDEALVWAQAAGFLSARVQGSIGECPGREPDMSAAAAGQLKAALAKIEAAHALMYNRERVVEDITNPGPQNIDGKPLTQLHLIRLEPKNAATVSSMMSALASLLLGQTVSGPGFGTEAMVWKGAAAFLAGRVQGAPDEMPGRAPDMSSGAAAAMRTALGQMEAFGQLMGNRERVVQDITNLGAMNIDGKKLTQLNLKRVDPQNTAAVQSMIGEVGCRLLGGQTKEPDAAEARVWAEAAAYLSGRIHVGAVSPTRRAPDMSVEAAAAMRQVLASVTNRKQTASGEAVLAGLTY